MDERLALTLCGSIPCPLRIPQGIVLMLLLSVSLLAQAVPNAPKGWQWYNVPALPKKSTPPTVDQGSANDPIMQMNALRAMVNEAKDEAILYPSIEHFTAFIKLQDLMAKNAVNFALSGKLAMLEHPELNRMIDHPTNSAAQKILAKQHQSKQISALNRLSQHDGFFFFYRGKNSLDQLAAKTVSSFAKLYHIAIIGVSMDSNALPLFAVNKRDSGQAKKLGVKALPALFIINPKTKTVAPVFYGVMSQAKMMQRLFNVSTNFQSERE